MDQDNKAKLIAIAINVTIEGHRRVKPSDCFIVKAQTISNKPARIRTIQGTTEPLPVEPPGRPGPLPFWGRTWPRFFQDKRQLPFVQAELASAS